MHTSAGTFAQNKNGKTFGDEVLFGFTFYIRLCSLGLACLLLRWRGTHIFSVKIHFECCSRCCCCSHCGCCCCCWWWCCFHRAKLLSEVLFEQSHSNVKIEWGVEKWFSHSIWDIKQRQTKRERERERMWGQPSNMSKIERRWVWVYAVWPYVEN